MKQAPNIRWHAGQVDREARWAGLGQRGATVWLTGLSGSGKSTIACALEAELLAQKVPCYRLDGDNLRHGLNVNLGFSPEDRDENVRRAAEAALLFSDFGTITLASFISPYREARARIRARHEQEGLPFFEVFVDTALSVCEARDPKGLYRKARSGQLQGMTGIDAPFEAPLDPDLRLDGEAALAASTQALLSLLGLQST